MKLITGLSAIIGLAVVASPSLAFSGEPTPYLINRDWVAASMACQKYGPTAAGAYSDMCQKLHDRGLQIYNERHQSEGTVDGPAPAKAGVEPR